MNQFFYESRGKEKVKELREEGLRSQALHRSGTPKSRLVRSLPKLIVLLLGILGVAELLIR